MTSAPERDELWSHTDPDRPPRVLAARYELGPALGRGGSAQVHRATDRRLHRSVAVKLFSPAVSGLDHRRRRQELHTLARLAHPGLVELHDAGREAGRDFLVMQLVEGPSLSDLVARGPLPVGSVVELGARLADALAYVHAAGVTHRDLKPDNVLIDDEGRPLLADFGVALLVDSTRVTGVGDVVGTAAYMAPEQVRGESVGPAADVYSLGLILLEALRGEREFPGTTSETVFARLLRLPSVPDELPAGLSALLRAMTATDAFDRPTAAAIASKLGSAMAALESETESLAAVTTGLDVDSGGSSARGGGSYLPTDPVGGPPTSIEPGVSRRRRLALGVAAGIVGMAAAASVGVAALGTGAGSGLGDATVPPQPAATAPAAAPAPTVGPEAMTPAASSRTADELGAGRDRVGDTAATRSVQPGGGSGGLPGSAPRPADTSAGVAEAPAEGPVTSTPRTPSTAATTSTAGDAASGGASRTPDSATEEADGDDGADPSGEVPTGTSDAPSSSPSDTSTASSDDA